MEERYSKKGLGTYLEEQRESTQQKRDQSAGAPWWLVVVLGLVLVGMASYIAWMNSRLSSDREGFTSFLPGPRTVSTPTVAPDSSLTEENVTLNGAIPSLDSAAEGWNSNPAVPLVREETVVTQVSPNTSTFTTPTPEAVPASTQTSYYIKAGEFSTKKSALFRVSELRQGNYPAKIIEPTSPGEMYIVSAGDFSSYTKARSQARAIGFILDIRTSVVEKK